MVTVCSIEESSACPLAPPNKAQNTPDSGPAVPPPLPQTLTEQNGTPKFVDVPAHHGFTMVPESVVSNPGSVNNCAGVQPDAGVTARSALAGAGLAPWLVCKAPAGIMFV